MREEFHKLAARGKIRRQTIDALAQLTRTGFCLHKSWGFGRIRRVDTVFSRMVVDFADKTGHSIDLEFAAQILKPATAEEEKRSRDVRAKQLSWILLPPGELSVASVTRYLKAASERRISGKSFDTARVSFLLGLAPSHIYSGRDEFEGYLAFIFRTLTGAVLENPIEGNAIYIFGDDWLNLSRLSKSELFSDSSFKFRRIVHSGDWQARLRTSVLGCKT
jgi:hypothetical protein